MKESPPWKPKRKKKTEHAIHWAFERKKKKRERGSLNVGQHSIVLVKPADVHPRQRRSKAPASAWREGGKKKSSEATQPKKKQKDVGRQFIHRFTGEQTEVYLSI